jgi:putative transposase
MTKLKALAGKVNRRKSPPVLQEDVALGQWRDYDGNLVDSQQLLISLLIPPAVKAFLGALDDEVKQLCGSRFQRGTDNQRWGTQPGSIILANQKVRIEKPRVRNQSTGKEVPLPAYDEFQNPRLFEEQVFADGLRKISQRDYDQGVAKIGASFGFTKSSVSRRWIKATHKALERLNERDLAPLNLVAVLIDGKRFGSRGVVVAMGVGADGKKYVLGIYECNTENSSACNELLAGLERRGLPERELLFVVDGGSGLNKCLEERYQVHLPDKRRAVRVRCFVHKWRNITDSLDEDNSTKAAGLYWGIREATRRDIAANCSASLEALLKEHNESALRSYLEAKDDLLVIQDLGLSPSLKTFFSTTNAMESLNSLTEEDLRRVKKWHDSNHFQRWLAAASLSAEKRMKRVQGFRHLPALQAALSRLCKGIRKQDIDINVRTGT